MHPLEPDYATNKGKTWNPRIPGLPSRYGHYKAFYFFNSGNIRVHGGDIGVDWQHATSLLWENKFSGDIRVSLAGYWVGALKWPNDGDLQDAYRRFDARLGKRMNWLAKDDELSLTLQNFNPEHSEFHGYLIERQTFLTYQVDF